MKKHHTILAVGLALACCTALSAPAAVQEAPAAPAPVKGIPLAKPAELMKLTKVQPGLYAMRCAGMDKNAANSYGPYDASAPAAKEVCAVPRFGCSSVVNGDFVGRNMDFFNTPAPYFIVWTDGGKDHYASLGMAQPPLDPKNVVLEITQAKDDIALYDTPEKTARLTTMAVDGVNEKGLCCTTHVVDPTDCNNTNKGTNPGAPELSMFMVCRYVLDHAATADEAIELLKKRSIRVMDPEVMFHWVITDRNHTYIVEVVDDQLRYTDKKKVMTNYLLTGKGINAHPWGLERMRILEEHYNEGTSVEGMYNLMRRVQYTQMYKPDTNPVWYSEYMGPALDGTDLTIHTPFYDPKLQALIKHKMEAFKVMTPENNPLLLWDTTYGNVYDMANKTMRLMMHEKYDTFYDAKL
ncbi:MAG: linear amide C-N hydrolase [Akkermansia sp.]|nr:linear amide C-N hydrolase [Akkermansia sp.]